MSQLAELWASQMPFTFGLPSAMRAAPDGEGGWADVGTTRRRTAATAAIEPVIRATFSQFRTGTPSAQIEPQIGRMVRARLVRVKPRVLHRGRRSQARD